MKSAKWVLMFLVAMLAAACGDNTVQQDGSMKMCVDSNEDGYCDQVPADGVDITVQVQTCSSNDYCYWDEYCVKDQGLTRRFGHTVKVCDTGCEVETQSNLGTICIVRDSDTCQRDGDNTQFCIGGTCRELTDAEKEAGGDKRSYCDETASEGEGEGEASVDTRSEVIAADQVILTVCYSNIPSGYFVQMSWSTSTRQDPNAWDAGRDRTAGADGCGSTEPINRDSIAVGFWSDVTRVRAQNAASGDWLTTSATVSRAFLTNGDGTTTNLSIRYFEYGKGRRLGTWGGDDPGCSDSSATCNRP